LHMFRTASLLFRLWKASKIANTVNPLTDKRRTHKGNMENKNHEHYMNIALGLARRAAAEGEVPVGAVIVHDGEVVATGYNRREQGADATAHAEIIAIRSACAALGRWRLEECDLYVTLEPCPMCAGAIVNARLEKVIFGAHDPKSGAMGSVVDLNALPLNHKPQVTAGVLGEESAELLREFFAKLRKKI